MTSENNDEQFVSGLYQTSEKPKSSAKTDEAILEYARHRVASNNKPKSFLSQKNRWLSVAASVALVSVIFVSQWQDFTPQELQSDADSEIPEAVSQDEAMEIQPGVNVVSNLADQQQRAATAARKAPSVVESAELLQVMGSRSKATDSGVKIECRYSVDGGKPLSNSLLAKYIGELTFKEKTALANALNSQIPLEQLSRQSEALAKLTVVPGFKEHYQEMAIQLKRCMAATGAAKK